MENTEGCYCEVIWSWCKDISPCLFSFFLSVCLSGIEWCRVSVCIWLAGYTYTVGKQTSSTCKTVKNMSATASALPYLGKMNVSQCLCESGWKYCHFPRCCLITKLTGFNEQRTDGCCNVTARYLLQAAADQSAVGKTLNFSFFCFWISIKPWKNQWRQRWSESSKGINN